MQVSILQTKLTPPILHRHTLARPRVQARLRDALDHRITLVHAGTGYGKSTALANLAQENIPLFWYSASESDTDAQQFLAHLIAAFRNGISDFPDAPLAILQDASAHATRAATDALLNALNDSVRVRALLVIDDYHLAASPDVNALTDHFLQFMPAPLHAIVSTRYPPAWEHLPAWRARGQILEIKRDDLAFTRDETAQLFLQKYLLDLSPREIDLLAEKTEGWPIALQLVWQELRAKPKPDVGTLLARGADSLETLFAYLAHDVLAQQPRAVQDFLLQTCVLHELDADACDAITSPSLPAGRVGEGSRALLAHLIEHDLFVIPLGGSHCRYHHLFADFLHAHATRADPAAVRARHRRAAEHYERAGNADEALYHLLQAKAFDDAARVIQEIGENVLRAGRLDTLAGWIDALPADLVAAHPLLMFYLGDLARLRSRFDDALAWYAQAERAWRVSNDVSGIARALRGQALVYLDTVRPAQAEKLLQESLRWLDGVDDRAAKARLLELLAENKLNMGKAAEAEQLRRQARLLREEGPSEDVLSVRVKLRTGRLDEARTILEEWARAERGQLHAPRAHRETLLILSLICSLQGNADDAFAAAQEGTTLGVQLNSPFVTAVGNMRLGHAHQMRGRLAEALRCYEQAIAIGDQLAVQRTRAEALWGMTRAHGFAGDLDAARRDAKEGIAIARKAGDAWVAALVQMALGASLVQAHRAREAIETLADALAAMSACGDTFGQCAARLWLALAHGELKQRERALTHLSEALTLAEKQRYEYLFTARTLLGMQDARAVVPLLLDARRHHSAFVARLLVALDLENVTAHAGYQLRVQTLGAFRVWRGEVEISAREWQRKKARQLLQLFVTQRGRMLERETIFETLWRGEAPETAARAFKVALNALNHALEPERAADAETAFIARQESAYGLRAGADVWIDADEFAQLIARGALEEARRARTLYQDDYLAQDARYDDWTLAERERLLALYLRAADRLAGELLTRGAYDECIADCEKILARDRCWEHAYRLMMQAHAARGDRAQARRVYEQCARVLREDLDVEPSEATMQMLREITDNRSQTTDSTA